MKMVCMRLKNFRCYPNETTLEFEDLTALVGKNDIGKSTILEALDIFFNNGNGSVKIDENDANVNEKAKGDLESVISVCFSDLPESIVIDSDFKTKLAEEYMLNSDRHLEIVKKYKGGKVRVFIRALHPTNPKCKDLLTLKNSELKSIIKDNNIDCSDKTVNSIMRKAIWEHFSKELNLQDVEIDASKEDARKIWEKLSAYIPVYSLFQSDRENCDDDNEVQDPLKSAVKEIISDVNLQNTLNEVAEKVRTKLKEVADRTLNKLQEMDPNVANTLNPIIPTSDKLKWADVFKSVSISGDENIPINKRGSGVKRLVLLSFFRAEAERKAENIENNGIIYAIEEPETSQHPCNQRLLINALKDLSKKENTQIIISTHSPVIVKELEFSTIRLITEKGEKRIVGKVDPIVLSYPSLNEVNYLAYGEVSEEYHDELYGRLKEMNWFEGYVKGKNTRPYKKLIDKRKIKTEYIISTEYIRNQIHHPENKDNPPYNLDELKQSIMNMRKYISERQKKEEKPEVHSL